MGSASAGEWVTAVLDPDCEEADDEGEDAGDDCSNRSDWPYVVRFRGTIQVLTSYCKSAVDIVPPASVYTIVADED